MADDEAITSKTITTAQWLKYIKPILEDFAADRQIQEEAWLSGSSKLYSPIEMICTLMDNFSFARVVNNPSSREVANLSETQRTSCARFADSVEAFASHMKGNFLERDVINDPEWDKVRAAAKELCKELYPDS